MRPSHATIVFALLTALTAFGCTASAPTLPLPPPTALATAPDADGLVTVEVRGAIEGAMIFGFNTRTMQGVIATADDLGEADVVLRAQGGDVLTVWQRVGTDSSQLLDIVVPTP